MCVCERGRGVRGEGERTSDGARDACVKKANPQSETLSIETQGTGVESMCRCEQEMSRPFVGGHAIRRRTSWRCEDAETMRAATSQ